jgi:hypothetical protein
MMEIKGTAVRSIPDFVQRHFAVRYDEWIEALPESSRKIMNGLIFTSNWYPMKEGLTIPMKTISKLFYNGDHMKTARTMGRFSADVALTGIYKFFIQFGSPKYIIERGGRVFATYFQPSETAVVNVVKNKCSMHITKFPEPDEIIEQNIAGWIERALEISGCKNVNVTVTKSLARNDNITEISISWD